MLANKDNITHYIPQRQPMVMINDLLEASETHAISRLYIDKENIFVAHDHLTEPGLVENIAQTAAAQVGYQCAVKNIAVPIGYIAAVKHLKIAILPRLNKSIITTVRITNQIMDITVAEGKIEEDGKLICSCEMRIFVKIQNP
jgi:3-hydroxyacyl-[acyl-carrier-protein] dehydratase